MSSLWSGADPTGAADASAYELSHVVIALKPVVLTGFRVWSPPTALARPGRKGRVWSVAQATVRTVDMDETLPSGWATYTFASPLNLAAGEHVLVSYETSGNYGAINGAFAGGSYVSADGAMAFPLNPPMLTANAQAGRFNITPGVFPNQSSAAFYGIDPIYTLAGGSPPTITAVGLSADGLTVTATITATDPDTLVGAAYLVDWGDGATSSGAGASYSHTYATTGVKAVLAQVSDASGLADQAAAGILLRAEADVLSSSPLQPLQVALRERLLGDPTLAGMVTGVYDQVPEDAEKPYVRIGDHLSIEDNAHGEFGREVTVTIHVWTLARGNASGQAIARRIGQLLDEQERMLTVDGHRVVSCRQEFDQALIDPDPQLRHHVLRFRIVTTQE